MLNDLLARNCEAIVQRWRTLIFETYPSDTSSFLDKEKNQFSNPVGRTIARELPVLFHYLAGGSAAPFPAEALGNIVRIRAVQEFNPGQATAFVFLLKEAVRRELAPVLRQADSLEELLDFESRVDRLALAVFESYVACREKIAEVRINEFKRQTQALLERMNRAPEEPARRQVD